MVDPSASPRHRGTAVYAGLLGAGLLWVTATVVAAVLAVGPVRSMACPSGGGFVHSDRVTLQVLPFGPTCRLEERDQVGAGLGTWVSVGPAPTWSRALLAGAVTALVGAAGLVLAPRRRGHSPVRAHR